MCVLERERESAVNIKYETHQMPCPDDYGGCADVQAEAARPFLVPRRRHVHLDDANHTLIAIESTSSRRNKIISKLCRLYYVGEREGERVRNRAKQQQIGIRILRLNLGTNGKIPKLHNITALTTNYIPWRGDKQIGASIP